MTIEIGDEQLLEAIKKLPAAKIKQLKSELSDDFINKKASEEIAEFRNFLLNGPVMSKVQYKQFEDSRKRFFQWRGY